MVEVKSLGFHILQEVTINPNKLRGRILEIKISLSGIQYLVRYFNCGKPEQVYFFENEIEAVVSNKTKIHKPLGN